MTATRSAVVQTLEQASRESWRKWRQHVEAGTGHSPEALAAYDASRLAGAALLDELTARAAAAAARAA